MLWRPEADKLEVHGFCAHEIKHIAAPSSPVQPVEDLEQNGYGRDNVAVQ